MHAPSADRGPANDNADIEGCFECYVGRPSGIAAATLGPQAPQQSLKITPLPSQYAN